MTDTKIAVYLGSFGTVYAREDFLAYVADYFRDVRVPELRKIVNAALRQELGATKGYAARLRRRELLALAGELASAIGIPFSTDKQGYRVAPGHTDDIQSYTDDAGTSGSPATLPAMEPEVSEVCENRERDYRIMVSAYSYDPADDCDGEHGEAVLAEDDESSYADYDPEDDFDNFTGTEVTDHVSWAVRVIKGIRTNNFWQPSVYPLPDEATEHMWLSVADTNWYSLTGYAGPVELVTETTVHLFGDWSPAERAEVFRRVTAR